MALASSRNDTRGNDPDCCSVSWSWIIRFYNNLAPLPFGIYLTCHMRPQPISFASGGFHSVKKGEGKNQARKPSRGIFSLLWFVRNKTRYSYRPHHSDVFPPLAPIVCLVSKIPPIKCTNQIPPPLDVFSDCQLTREKKEEKKTKFTS